MLPVCEDVGLAAAAASGAISLQTLLLYSAVCGVGLHTELASVSTQHVVIFFNPRQIL